jgi:hypothetical protein
MALPDFKPGMLYLVRGSTLNAIELELRTNRPCCITGGGLSIAAQSDQAIFVKGEADGHGGGISNDVDLPFDDVDDDKIYFLTKPTLDKLFAAARRNLMKVVTGTGLAIQYTADGVIPSSSS